MKDARVRVLVAAVAAGVLAGAGVTRGGLPPPSPSPAASASAAPAWQLAPADRHACRALNNCKSMGGCKNDANECAGQNSCKFKGGCDGAKVEAKKRDNPQLAMARHFGERPPRDHARTPPLNIAIADAVDPVPPGAMLRLGSERLRHAGGVTALAVAPDGAAVVTAGADNRLVVWHVPTGKLLAQADVSGSPVTALAFAPDRHAIALARDNGTIELRDPHGLESIATFRAGAPVASLSWSADSATLASAGTGVVKLWNGWGPSGSIPAAEARGARVVAFAPRGSALAWGGDDGIVHLGTADGKAPARALAGHRAGVLSLAWSPDGASLASGSADETIRTWDPATGALRETLPWPLNAVNALAWSPDGKLLVSGSGTRLLRVWNGNKGRNMTTDEPDRGAITGVAFASAVLITASADGSVRYWQPDAQPKEVQGLWRHRGAIDAVGFSPDGQWATVASADGSVSLWSPTARMRMMTMVTPTIPCNVLNDIAFAPDGAWLATAQDNTDVILWPLKPDATGHFHGRRELRLPGETVRAVAVSPDGKQLLAGTATGRVRVIDPDPAAVPAGADARFAPERLNWDAHGAPITVLRVSPDGKTLASAARDGSVTLWDLNTHAQRLLIPRQSKPVTSLAFSGNGELWIAIPDPVIRSYDTATGKPLRELKGHTGAVIALAATPDGAWLASGGQDRVVRLWDLKAGKVARQFTGHTAPVRALALSADAHQLLSGSDDTTGLLWQLDAQ